MSTQVDLKSLCDSAIKRARGAMKAKAIEADRIVVDRGATKRSSILTH